MRCAERCACATADVRVSGPIACRPDFAWGEMRMSRAVSVVPCLSSRVLTAVIVNTFMHATCVERDLDDPRTGLNESLGPKMHVGRVPSAVRCPSRRAQRLYVTNVRR